MKRITILTLTIALVVPNVCLMAASSDLGARDTLRLVTSQVNESEVKIVLEVHNDEKLNGLDIPIRFGQPGDPIDLKSVAWSGRVSGWELRHAAVDSVNKTVIIGLISILYTVRPSHELATAEPQGESKVVELVFTVGVGYSPRFETFTTDGPGHYLAFFYNRYEDGGPFVEEFVPKFEVVARDE